VKVRRAASLIAQMTLAALLTSATASAYCRTTTVSPPAGFTPTITTCWDQGDALFWKDKCIAFGVEASGSKRATYDDVVTLATQAFQTWMDAACTTGAISITASAGKPVPVSCSKVDYVKGAKNNVNVILFHDDSWPYNDSANTLALTTLTFNTETAQILDADMEINTASNDVTTVTPVPPNSYDLLSILTHEAGHFFGLAHTGHPEATMFATYKPQSVSMRLLAADDVSGICAMYPTSGVRPTTKGNVVADACGAVPRGALQGSCPAVASGCCSVATGAPASGTPAGIAGGGALLALILRRRRARRVSRSGTGTCT
jgi:hypothetical protein